MPPPAKTTPLDGTSSLLLLPCNVQNADPRSPVTMQSVPLGPLLEMPKRASDRSPEPGRSAAGSSHALRLELRSGTDFQTDALAFHDVPRKAAEPRANSCDGVNRDVYLRALLCCEGFCVFVHPPAIPRRIGIPIRERLELARRSSPKAREFRRPTRLVPGSDELVMLDVMKIGGAIGWQRSAAPAAVHHLRVSNHHWPPSADQFCPKPANESGRVRSAEQNTA